MSTPFGPVVVSTSISKSGGSQYHGEAYFDARNSVLNANDWVDNHQGIPQGPQHYYYPGGNFGGPVPGTHKNLFFWGGYERWLQNQGNANVLKSYIPTPEMMAGNFTTDNADNRALCPNGFYPKPNNSFPQGGWCNDLSGTVFPDGSSIPAAPVGTNNPNSGNRIPAQFIDPGAAALAKIWPTANANSATSVGNVYYDAPIENLNNGWFYRFRIDYQFGPNTKIYGSYQQAYDAQLAQGNGASTSTGHRATPSPTRAVAASPKAFRGKSLAGHFVHNFSASMTNDFMAAWAFGDFPFVQPNPSAAYRSTLGYLYGKCPFRHNLSTSRPTGPAETPASPTSRRLLSLTTLRASMPSARKPRSSGDTLTKVWGAHTVKMGAFTQNTDNYQSTFSTFQDGSLTFAGNSGANLLTSNTVGSPNRVANFTMGILSGCHRKQPLLLPILLTRRLHFS